MYNLIIIIVQEVVAACLCICFSFSLQPKELPKPSSEQTEEATSSSAVVAKKKNEIYSEVDMKKDDFRNANYPTEPAFAVIALLDNTTNINTNLLSVNSI